MRVFITATDTDAGKTYVTAGLTRQLIDLGVRARALKPVCCGRKPGELNADVRALLEAQGWDEAATGRVNLHDFPDFSAPAAAAERAGARIGLDGLARWCEAAAQGASLTLIEGVGGLMVPLARNLLVADWLAAMSDARVLLVARARLGGINHALLTLKALEAMGRAPDWVVVNDADGAGEAMVEGVAEAMRPFLHSETRLLTLCHRPRTVYAASKTVAELAADMARRCECAC